MIVAPPKRGGTTRSRGPSSRSLRDVRRVYSLAASHPWTYWLAIPLCIADAFLVAGIAIGYLVVVVLPRRRMQRLQRDRSIAASTR